MADSEIIEEVPQHEDMDLDQDFIDESPSILTEDEIRDIAKSFGVPFEEMKAITRNMTKIRNQVKEQINE